MPSNLALVTSSGGLPFRTRGSKSWLLFENPIRSSLHLASFSWNPSILACLARSSTACWSLLTLPFVTISEQDVSSTYFHMSAGVFKSLIMTRNNQGPNFVPWGTPFRVTILGKFNALFPIHNLGIVQNCRGLLFCNTAGLTYFSTLWSSASLDKIGVREMGQRCLLISLMGLCFGTPGLQPLSKMSEGGI